MTEPHVQPDPETHADGPDGEAGSRPTDATRRRFEEILAAKKSGGKGVGGADGPRRQVPGRPSEAKGSRGFTRRKV